MSNYSGCLLILTQLVGFEKSDNDEKITLPDQVDIDTLIEFKNVIQYTNIEGIFDGSTSYETKMNETNESNSPFWPCNRCTYHNPIDSNECQICALPQNVCIKQ